jgi:hypothetical protein
MFLKKTLCKFPGILGFSSSQVVKRPIIELIHHILIKISLNSREHIEDNQYLKSRPRLLGFGW